jgi:hypothetical protein
MCGGEIEKASARSPASLSTVERRIAAGGAVINKGPIDIDVRVDVNEAGLPARSIQSRPPLG